MTESHSTPPIIAGELASPARRVVWPIVLGVIAIVGGVLAGMYAVAGSVMSVLIPAFGWTSYTPSSAMPFDPGKLMRDHAWLLLLAYGQLGLGAVIVLIGGIGLVRRKWWGARLTHIWGALGILLALGMGVSFGLFEARIMSAMFTSIAAGAGPRGGPPPEVGYVAGVFAGVFTAILASIFPMFVLIWFSLASVRAEVAKWRAGGSE